MDHRAGRVARRRVDDQPGRLVDDEQVVVLVDDAQDDVRLGLERERHGLRHEEPEVGARADDRVRAQRRAVGAGQVAGRDELLDVAARQARGVGHVAVDPDRDRPVRYGQFADERAGSGHPVRPAARDAARARAPGR